MTTVTAVTDVSIMVDRTLLKELRRLTKFKNLFKSHTDFLDHWWFSPTKL